MQTDRAIFVPAHFWEFFGSFWQFWESKIARICDFGQINSPDRTNFPEFFKLDSNDY